MASNQKEMLKSKTFWVNLIAIVIFVVQLFVGADFVIPVEIQGAILAIINFLLRLITKEEIVWETQETRQRKAARKK